MDPLKQLNAEYEEYLKRKAEEEYRRTFYYGGGGGGGTSWIACTTQSIWVSGFTPAHDEPEEDDDEDEEYDIDTIGGMWVL